MPLLTVRAIDAHKPKVEPYKLTLDRGLQLRIAPDGARTLLVRYTVKRTAGERQHRLSQEYGEGPGQIRLAAACAEAARIRALRDTKNRSDHKLLLSRQAMDIVERNCLEPEDPLFAIVDARKTLAWINALAGTKVQGHGLRATFASIAEELVSGGVLKRMLNHADGGDVTLGHYVGKSEAQLRAGWQTVADFVEAARPPAQIPA
jgi:integrase